MKSPLCIPDNQNRFTGGFPIKANPKGIKALKQLSALTIWDMIESNPVFFVSSSFGQKDIRNKERKLLEVEPGLESDEYVVYTENVMGFLSVEGQQIQIYSRFDSSGHENKERQKNTKDFFLMHMLSTVCGVSQSALPSTLSNEHVFDFYSLFFPKLLKDAMHQGLFRAYQKYEYNDMRVKGQIDVSRHLRTNIPFNGRVAYSSREYDSDNFVTQLIRHTIEYLKTKPIGQQILGRDTETRTAVSMIIKATPTYDTKLLKSVFQKNTSKPVSHPYYNKYIHLQQLCLAILQHKKVSYGGNSNKQIQGILFDGAWLWEEYVAALLKHKFKHYTNKSAFCLFERDGKPFQEIIPDYLSLEDNAYGGKKGVADAKYMFLHGDHLPAERACAVYYKTIMYMLRFKSKKGFLFHPFLSTNYMKDETGSSYESSVKELNIIDNDGVKLYTVGLEIPFYNKDEKFSVFQQRMQSKEIKFRDLISRYMEDG